MGKFFKTFGTGVLLGIVGVLAYLIGSAGSYAIGLATTLIGLALFGWILPDTIMNNLPGSVLASVLLIAPFIFIATGSIKASITSK